MSAGFMDLHAPEGGWTTDDLDELPETTRHFELLDGSLIVSPSPTNVHQTLAMRLGVLLGDLSPEPFEVTQSVEVRISRQRSFIPDVLIVTREAGSRSTCLFQPHDVVTAMEIVSPTSRSLDAVTKPALYAEAGIPFYWRIETDPAITIHTHRLDATAGVYVLTGSYDGTVTTDEPWPMTFEVAQLKPRGSADP